MIVERVVFQAKYGKGDELVRLFKQMSREAPASATGQNFRVLTDRSGPFFTVVIEMVWESLAEWEKGFAQMFSDRNTQDLMERSTPLIESGRREFYNIEM